MKAYENTEEIKEDKPQKFANIFWGKNNLYWRYSIEYKTLPFSERNK